MTPLATIIVEQIRAAIAATDHVDPADRNLIFQMLMADVRSRSVVSLSNLPEPTEPIRDPRAVSK